MTGLATRSVTVNGHSCRIWEKGEGKTVGYLAGLVGLPSWTPFLDKLASRYRVVAPSLPGFFGATGYEDLDNTHDWIAAALDLLEAADLIGAPMVSSSVGATIAAEVAAVNPSVFERLVLAAPLGYVEDELPVPHIWATLDAERHALLCRHQDKLEEVLAPPAGEDMAEWKIRLIRANAAGARLLWPMCDTGLGKRLHRIKVPTMIVWGEHDSIVSADYAALFAKRMSGPVEVRTVPDAGHLVDIDQPTALADLTIEFLGSDQQ